MSDACLVFTGRMIQLVGVHEIRRPTRRTLAITAQDGRLPGGVRGQGAGGAAGSSFVWSGSLAAGGAGEVASFGASSAGGGRGLQSREVVEALRVALGSSLERDEDKRGVTRWRSKPGIAP
jgi:hypothetical protein